MAMGKRRRRLNRTSLWVATQDLPRTGPHPFYSRLNQILDQADFDGYVEAVSAARVSRQAATSVCC
jgi:hypothetical protein